MLNSHKQKKIAHVQVIPKLSGVQRVSLDILSNLPSYYDKYIIFGGDYEAEKELINECERNKIKVIFIEDLRREISFRDFNAFFNLLKLFNTMKFDIIHTNSTKPGIIARLAAKVARCKKIVHTVHGIAFHRFEKFPLRIIYLIIEAFCSFFSHYLISVNNYYLKYYPHIKNKKTIHNCVNTDNFNLSYKNNGSILNVGFMSRLDFQKDPLTLCKAILYGIENGFFKKENIKVLIGGDGELKSECQIFIEKHSLESVFKFVGWVKNKDDFYNSIDVFCLPSLYEAFGLVLLESAFYEIPAIASRVEGIPEIVKHDFNGMLITPRNYQELAICLKKYNDDKNLLYKHGRNAKNNLTENFKFQSMIDNYIGIYED